MVFNLTERIICDIGYILIEEHLTDMDINLTGFVK